MFQYVDIEEEVDNDAPPEECEEDEVWNKCTIDSSKIDGYGGRYPYWHPDGLGAMIENLGNSPIRFESIEAWGRYDEDDDDEDGGDGIEETIQEDNSIVVEAEN